MKRRGSKSKTAANARNTRCRPRRSDCPWGPVIGTLRHIDLAGGRLVRRLGAPAPLRTNATGTTLLIETDASAAAGLDRPRSIEYVHAMGGRYVHKFESRARARVTSRGLVLTGISVKPFIEG